MQKPIIETYLVCPYCMTDSHLRSYEKRGKKKKKSISQKRKRFSQFLFLVLTHMKHMKWRKTWYWKPLVVTSVLLSICYLEKFQPLCFSVFLSFLKCVLLIFSVNIFPHFHCELQHRKPDSCSKQQEVMGLNKPSAKPFFTHLFTSTVLHFIKL